MEVWQFLVRLKHLLTFAPRNALPKYLPKRNENFSLPKESYKHIHGNFILEFQMVNNLNVHYRQVDEPTVVMEILRKKKKGINY